MIVKFEKRGSKDDVIDIVKNGQTWNSPLGDIIECDKDMSVLGRNTYKVLMISEDEGRVIRFSDLHRHSDGSILDGLTKVKDMAKLTEYSGALTDHGDMYNYVEYVKAMTNLGKKPIIGFEAYCADLEDNLYQNHLVLLAKNETGYHNLLKLASEASKHFHYKPHVTFDLLEQYHEGVIALSACIKGLVPDYIYRDMPEKAEEALDKYISIFGEDFYLEYQDHKFETENTVMQKIKKLADEKHIKIVATTDAHYPKKEDAKVHEILLCMQTKTTLDDPKHWSFSGEGYYIHNSEDMEERFKGLDYMLDETLNLADKVDFQLELGKQNLPVYQIPAEYKNDNEYMYKLACNGLKQKLHDMNAAPEVCIAYKKRLDYEYSVIKQMGFASYFLIVWDYINWAKQHNIYVGPGRGSAAGSLLAYSLGITDLDPIKYNLLFERFLNPDRISMPDIDVDFEHTGRDAVDKYVYEKYGEGKVSQVITFGTLASKMVLKDVARVMGKPVSYGTKLADMIDNHTWPTIADALSEEGNPELKAMYNNPNDSECKTIIDAAMRLEGLKRHKSVHACARLLSAIPISDVIPTEIIHDKDTDEDVVVTQVQGPECEELSLLKMDFLGLKNMTVIHQVSDGILKDLGEARVLKDAKSNKSHFFYEDITLKDRATYKMLAKGITGGVFQLESPGMTKVVTRMLYDVDTIPEDKLDELFERLIAAVALYRPGPMQYIDQYIESMKDRSKIVYDCPEEQAILAPTYGVIVFQEQVMQLVQKLAGYTLARADLVRKAMGKKKHDVMAAERDVFIYGNKKAFEAGKDKAYVPGCVENGISEEIATQIWDKMASFASYAFNRSHAACYAYIAYITAFLSCHYPVHFYAAMLNAFGENTDKTKEYLSQAIKRNLNLLAPDINESEEGFTPEYSLNAIRFGLKGISSVKAAASKIVEERRNGLFSSISDFYFRMNKEKNNVNSAAMSNLIFAGALDSFGYNKKSLVSGIERLKTNLDDHKKKVKSYEKKLAKYSEMEEGEAKDKKMAKLVNPSDSYTVPEDWDVFVEEKDFESSYKAKQEFDAIGTYVTEHPTKDAKKYAKKNHIENLTDIASLSSVMERKPVALVGIIKDFQVRFTKSKEKMYSFTLDDEVLAIKCVVFPRAANSSIGAMIGEDAVVCIAGSFMPDENYGNQVVVDKVFDIEMLKAECINRPTKIVFSVNTIEQRDNILNLLSGVEQTAKTDVEIQMFCPRSGNHLDPCVKIDYLDHQLIEKLKNIAVDYQEFYDEE